MITSVSYRKSGSPQPEAGYSYNTTGTFKKANSVEPSSSCPGPGPSQSQPSNPSKNQSKKSSGSFWQNLFRPSRPDSIIIEKTVVPNGNGTLERSKSSETINSICSTNSFSFVSSPKKYKGRKKGKRIPLPDDSLSRPPLPTARVKKISTLTRLGMKIGLKSKYNLQSCESLHRLNTIELNKSNTSSLNRTLQKRKAPLPPSGVQLNGIVARCDRELEFSPVVRPTQVQAPAEPVPSTSASAYGKPQVLAHRRCYSEGNDYSGYISPKSRYHVRGKRRAPAPPNPFGDPDAPEMPDETQTQASARLSIVSENDELTETVQPVIRREATAGCSKLAQAKSPRNSYVEKEVQSDNEYSNHPGSLSLLNHEKAVNDEVKAQLAILKNEADASALKLVKPSQANKSKSKSVCDPTPPDDIGGKRSPMETPPVKITPRPWYKRSSSKSSSSQNSVPPKKGPKPTMMLMAKFSDLDREASRIVEENRRRSAEVSYNETAKELITMFNEFNINQQTINADSSSTSVTTVTTPPTNNANVACSSKTTSSQVVGANSGVSINSADTKSPLGNQSKQTSSANAISATASTSATKVPTPEEPKKLAVVQPQSQSQSNPPKSDGQTQSISSVSATRAASAASSSTRLFENPVTPLPSPLTLNNTPISIADRIPQTPEGWACPRCTLKNEYWRSFCDACHYRNSVGSTVQSISSLFENVNRQIEVRTSTPAQNYNPPTNSAAKSSTASQPQVPPGIPTNSTRRKKSSGFPENFLSQLPLKEKLAKEEKLEGMKLHGDPEMEELDIAKLREARVAFFEKNKPEIKPNNLTPANTVQTATIASATNMLNKENVFSESEDEYALDALLEIHQQLNPNMSGTGPQTWKPLNGQKFRPMLESIVETTNDNFYNGGFGPVYENCRMDANDNQSSTNMFMQNIQIQLQDHIRYFEQLSSGENTPEENDQFNFQENMDGRRRDELTLEEYQKLGAIPKHFQNGNRASSSRRHSQPEESSRRGSGSERRSNGHNNQMNFGESYETSPFTGDTLAITKLLRHLEWAIAKGDHRLAASLAHDLALCKVNCVVSKATQQIVIRVYVEDRLMQQGPFQVQVTPSTTVKELKAKIECDWGIPTNFQKWILGRKIAEDDDQTLSFYEIVNDSMAFLYLVTPGSENENLENANDQPNQEIKSTTTPTRVPNRAKLASPGPVNENLVDEISQPPRPKPPTIAETKMSQNQTDSKDLKKLQECNANKAAEIVQKIPTDNYKTSNLPLVKNKVDIPNIPQTRNAQIQYGPAAEATNVLPKLPKTQSAQLKPGSPEFIMINVKDEIPKVNQSRPPAGPPVLAQQATQPVNPQNQNINITRAIDIANNNLNPSQIQPIHKTPDKPKTGKIQVQPTTSKAKIDVKVNASPPEKKSRRKFFRGSIRKVDQGTSIEKDAPICTEVVAGNFQPADKKSVAKEPICGLNVNANQNDLPPRLPPKNPTTTPPLVQKQKENSASAVVVTNSDSMVQQKMDGNTGNTPNGIVLKENATPLVISKNSAPTVVLKENLTQEIVTNKSPPLIARNHFGASGVTVKPSSPVAQNQTVANSPVPTFQNQPVSPSTPPTSCSPISRNQPSTSGAAPKNYSPVPQNKTVAPVRNIENSQISAVLKLSVAPEALNKDAVVPDSPKGSVTHVPISKTKSSVSEISKNENLTSEMKAKNNSQSPDPPDEIISSNKKPTIYRIPPPPQETKPMNSQTAAAAVVSKMPTEIVAPSVQNAIGDKTVKNSQTPIKPQENQPTGLPPKNLISKPSLGIENAQANALNITNSDNNSLRRNSAPANLRRVPPVNKPFVKTIGGIFMSRVVGNLVAAAENLNRNQQQVESKPLPGTSRNVNANIANAPPPVVKKIVVPDIRAKLNSVAAGSSNSNSGAAKPDDKKLDNFQTYKRMLQLMENEDFIKTTEEVDCPICLSKIPPGEGITLRDCLHSFCAECLVGAIQYSEEPQVRCPFRDNTYSCDSYMQEREVKGLAPADLYDRHLARSVKLAESKMSNAFHCKTNDCTGWCIYEDDVNVFNCPVCRKRNCLTCQAIHEGQDCQEHQRRMAIAAETDEDAKSSRVMLEKMISRGEALDCPACHVVLLKKWGCDWVRCSYCKTEICWVTKGFRWGPNGKGDTSGGCKCGINGVRCHPKCTYCH